MSVKVPPSNVWFARMEMRWTSGVVVAFWISATRAVQLDARDTPSTRVPSSTVGPQRSTEICSKGSGSFWKVVTSNSAAPKPGFDEPKNSTETSTRPNVTTSPSASNRFARAASAVLPSSKNAALVRLRYVKPISSATVPSASAASPDAAASTLMRWRPNTWSALVETVQTSATPSICAAGPLSTSSRNLTGGSRNLTRSSPRATRPFVACTSSRTWPSDCVARVPFA